MPIHYKRVPSMLRASPGAERLQSWGKPRARCASRGRGKPLVSRAADSRRRRGGFRRGLALARWWS
eukprot:10335280-Alexandrium_andersonii.AAC.1